MSKTIIRERLLHEYQLGRTAAQARRNICEALGVDAIKRSTAQNWFNKFKQGNYCVRDKSRSGRPKQLNDKAILQAIMENSTLTTRMIAMDNQCSHTAIEKILHRAGFKGPVFQQDNARPHVARRSLEIIEQLGWERLIHPPYSPDVAPSDYHLFRSLQHSLAGKRFSEVDDVKKHLTTYFAGKSTEFYKQGIEKLPERWKKIVEHNGNYFE